MSESWEVVWDSLTGFTSSSDDSEEDTKRGLDFLGDPGRFVFVEDFDEEICCSLRSRDGVTVD